MKKFLALMSAIVLCCTPVSAHGCNNRGNDRTTVAGYCVCCSKDCTFTDADGDGLCDECGEKCGYTDEDKDRVCDVCEKSCRYTDCDEDGYCDLCGAKSKRHCKNVPQKSGHRHGKHGHC